jgi:hypothetical protein
VSGHITIGLLVALTAFQGFIVAFNQPARLALVPSLVPGADLASAVAINSVVFNLARFVGPMLAGLAIIWSGVSAAFAANAISYIPFLLALAYIRIAPASFATAQRRSFGADLREGVRYTATHPGIAALLVLLIAIGMGGGRSMNCFLDLQPMCSEREREASRSWRQPSGAALFLGASGLAIAPIRPV